MIFNSFKSHYYLLSADFEQEAFEESIFQYYIVDISQHFSEDLEVKQQLEKSQSSQKKINLK